MSFLTEYRVRFSAEIRTNISNPQNSGATTPDTTLEGYAYQDVLGEFKKRGITPDETDTGQIGTAINGIKARLLVFTAQTDDSAWKEFKADVKFLAETTSRDRIIPSTDSLLNPSFDQLNSLPQTDMREFKGYVPGAPASPTTGDSVDSNINQ